MEFGTKANVDFLLLMWRTVEVQYAFRKHAITILPDPGSTNLRVLCLRYYDVVSVGWSFGSECAICRDASREMACPLNECLAPAEACTCNICTRQVPSLKDLAFNAHFFLSFNIEQFELTLGVTYNQYR